FDDQIFFILAKEKGFVIQVCSGRLLSSTVVIAALQFLAIKRSFLRPRTPRITPFYFFFHTVENEIVVVIAVVILASGSNSVIPVNNYRFIDTRDLYGIIDHIFTFRF